MEEGGGNKRRVQRGASEKREERRSPICDGAQTKKVFSGTTPSWIPHATVNKSSHEVDGLVEKAERKMKVRTISDNQRSFAAQFSSTMAAETGAEKPVSGSRWATTSESSSDTTESPDRVVKEELLTQGVENDDRLGGQPQDDQGEESGDESPSAQRAPVRGSREAEGEKAKDKPKALGGLVKGPWSKEEDQKIIECIAKKMTRWSEIAECVEGRVGKQCRERWFNHLDPTLRKCSWTPEEDEILVNGQARFGNSWTKIGKLLPGRSENAVKNRWNSAARKKGIKNQQRNMAGLATMAPAVPARGAMHSDSLGFHQGMPPERRLGGQVRFVPVPSWQAMPQIHHIHAQIAPSAASILASPPPLGMDGNQLLCTYPGGISHAPMHAWRAFPVHHQPPVLDPSNTHGSPDMREHLQQSSFGRMAACQHMYGQPSGVQPAFPMTGRVIGPGPLPGPVLPGVSDNSQQPTRAPTRTPTPHLVCSSPPIAATTKVAENIKREVSNGVPVETDGDKDSPESGSPEVPNGVPVETAGDKDSPEKGRPKVPNGVPVEEDTDKDSPDDDDELSLSNIMLKMSLEDQTNMVGSYNGCKSSHRMAGLMGRENVFDACNGDPVLRGFPEDDFGAMCASFDGTLDITALDGLGQDPNLGLQGNDRPTRASDLLTSPASGKSASLARTFQ